MTKLHWTCDYIDGVYLFHTGIKGDKKYEKGLKKMADRMPEITEENEGLYEEMMGEEKFQHNKFISEDEVDEFLLNCAYGTPAVMKAAKRGYSMGGSDGEGVLKVDGKLFPPPENWQERGEGFWCGGEHHYDDEKGHTYETDGKVLLQWNTHKEELDAYDFAEHEATIFQFERWDEGEWELEIEGDFDYYKLSKDTNTGLVLYDGKEFKLVNKGHKIGGWKPLYYKKECGYKRDDDCEDVLDKDGNKIMEYTWEEVPTADYLWEGYGFE